MLAAETRRKLHRRSRATALAAAVLLAGGALTSCGFDAPTDRVNDIAAGANNRDASVDALGVRLLASAAGEGRLIGALANNDSSAASLVSVSGEGLTVGEFEPIEVPGGGRVNLADADVAPVPITGEFTAGQVVEMELTFDADGSESVTLNVPVVKNCHQYTQVPSPSAPADEESSAEDEGTEESADDEASAEESDDTYLCDHEAAELGH